jgi:radical SAM superfamily enzyme YgiQ (UPF0313 family)
MTDRSTAGPLRPPSEAYSLLVRVTKNCPWNRCAFCSVFRGKRFEQRPVEEVKEDILLAKRSVDEVRRWAEETGIRLADAARFNGLVWLREEGVKSVFLQDSDSLVIRTNALIQILEFIRETFPEAERICTYARGKTLFKKPLEKLRQLRKAGLSRLHIGLESGDDELLAYIQKGATADEMIEAGRKAKAAGFEASEYIIPGLGGKERWEQHAMNSARVLNAINPHFIRLRTFHLVEGAPIYERAEREEFTIQSIEGLLIEIRRFIQQLDVTSELVAGDYAFNYFMGDIDGKLSQDKDRILSDIDDALARWRDHGEPQWSPFLGGLNRRQTIYEKPAEE